MVSPLHKGTHTQRGGRAGFEPKDLDCLYHDLPMNTLPRPTTSCLFTGYLTCNSPQLPIVHLSNEPGYVGS